jgi:hypothetical protein
MSAGEIAIFAMHKRTSARAAVVSPPWYGNRTCNGDRFSRSDYVHHARSDGVPRLADANRSRRRSWWTHANRRKCAAPLCTGDSFHNHGWLTSAAPSAALDGRMRIVANVWLRFARAIRSTATAGLRQPLPPGAARGAALVDTREWLRMCGSVSAGECVFCRAGFSRVLCVSGSMCIMAVKRPQRTHTGLPNVRQLTRLGKS